MIGKEHAPQPARRAGQRAPQAEGHRVDVGDGDARQTRRAQLLRGRADGAAQPRLLQDEQEEDGQNTTW